MKNKRIFWAMFVAQLLCAYSLKAGRDAFKDPDRVLERQGRDVFCMRSSVDKTLMTDRVSNTTKLFSLKQLGEKRDISLLDVIENFEKVKSMIFEKDYLSMFMKDRKDDIHALTNARISRPSDPALYSEDLDYGLETENQNIIKCLENLERIIKLSTPKTTGWLDLLQEKQEQIQKQTDLNIKIEENLQNFYKTIIVDNKDVDDLFQKKIGDFQADLLKKTLDNLGDNIALSNLNFSFPLQAFRQYLGNKTRTLLAQERLCDLFLKKENDELSLLEEDLYQMLKNEKSLVDTIDRLERKDIGPATSFQTDARDDRMKKIIQLNQEKANKLDKERVNNIELINNKEYLYCQKLKEIQEKEQALIQSLFLPLHPPAQLSIDDQIAQETVSILNVQSEQQKLNQKQEQIQKQIEDLEDIKQKIQKEIKINNNTLKVKQDKKEVLEWEKEAWKKHEELGQHDPQDFSFKKSAGTGEKNNQN